MGPYNKDDSILGSISASPYLGKLPYRHCIRDNEKEHENYYKAWGLGV